MLCINQLIQFDTDIAKHCIPTYIPMISRMSRRLAAVTTPRGTLEERCGGELESCHHYTRNYAGIYFWGGGGGGGGGISLPPVTQYDAGI